MREERRPWFSALTLLCVLAAVTTVWAQEDPDPELSITSSAASVSAGATLILRVEAAAGLQIRAGGRPVMATIERLENPETGSPVGPEFDGAVWRPIAETTRVLDRGVGDVVIETTGYPPGTYLFRVSGGLPTEMLSSGVVAVAVTNE